MVAPVFLEGEPESLRRFPQTAGRAVLVLHPAADSAFIDPGRDRGPADLLGLGVVVCTLPWPGFVPGEVASPPPAAVSRLAEQPLVPRPTRSTLCRSWRTRKSP